MDSHPSWHEFKELRKEVKQNHEEEMQLLREIKKLLGKSKPVTASVANVFILKGGFKMADNVLVMNVGDTAVDTLTPRSADGVSPSGGVVSNVAVQFNDPSASAVLQPDGTILLTGLAASTNGVVSGSVSCTVTDTDGAISTWTIPFTVLVNAVQPPPPPTQLTQSVANVFVVTPASPIAAFAAKRVEK